MPMDPGNRRQLTSHITIIRPPYLHIVIAKKKMKLHFSKVRFEGKPSTIIGTLNANSYCCVKARAVPQFRTAHHNYFTFLYKAKRRCSKKIASIQHILVCTGFI